MDKSLAVDPRSPVWSTLIMQDGQSRFHNDQEEETRTRGELFVQVRDCLGVKRNWWDRQRQLKFWPPSVGMLVHLHTHSPIHMQRYQVLEYRTSETDGDPSEDLRKQSLSLWEIG